MKLLEKFIYSGIIFVGSYVVVSVGLRVMNLTSNYISHIVGGIVATVLGFIVYLFVNQEINLLKR